jgi:glutaredoxin
MVHPWAPSFGVTTPDPMQVNQRKVVLYHAQGCHLCERALRVLHEVRQEIPFDFEEIDIDGDPELEARYREWLPVVEIDGERAFVYYVDSGALRRKLAAQT